MALPSYSEDASRRLDGGALEAGGTLGVPSLSQAGKGQDGFAELR
jgi:hypothetical protein